MREADSQSTTPLIGQNAGFLATVERASRLAAIDRPVLVVGERGTGKELIADRLHFLSPRWAAPFVKLNCAALPESLLDAELFGHEAGAFTGANRARIGRFGRADGGTLFLDEIASASPLVQDKLLRAIEYGSFDPVGADSPRHADVRLVAATNLDLPTLAAAGRFRADLLDRLAFEVVTLPPLRARRDDIPVLANHFAVGMTRRLGRAFFAGFTDAAMAMLMQHDWPGNVRELRNAVERAVFAAADPAAPVDRILLDPFASPWRPAAPEATPAAEPAVAPNGGFAAVVAAEERRLLAAALSRAGGNQRAAASALALSYHAFRRLARRHGLIGPDADR